MILYLDTSSLAKIYLDEPCSDDVVEWIGTADATATSRVTYPEIASALARRCIGGALTPGDLRLSLDDLEAGWGDYLVVDLAERLAAKLAVRHVLRGFDAIQLAAAVTLRDAIGPDGVAFSSFDAQLTRAAVEEGLIVLEPGDA
jgi:predicted nucleic acid-binding protein